MFTPDNHHYNKNQPKNSRISIDEMNNNKILINDKFVIKSTYE